MKCVTCKSTNLKECPQHYSCYFCANCNAHCRDTMVRHMLQESIEKGSLCRNTTSGHFTSIESHVTCSRCIKKMASYAKVIAEETHGRD